MENFQDRGVWIRIRFVLIGWIRIVLRGWIRSRSISDRIRNPELKVTPLHGYPSCIVCLKNNHIDQQGLLSYIGKQ